MQAATIECCSLNLPLLKNMMVTKIPPARGMVTILQDILKAARRCILISVMPIYIDSKRSLMGYHHGGLERFQGIEKLIRLHDVRGFLLPPIKSLCSTMLINRFCPSEKQMLFSLNG
jgi:hypothetical protein